VPGLPAYGGVGKVLGDRRHWCFGACSRARPFNVHPYLSDPPASGLQQSRTVRRSVRM